MDISDLLKFDDRRYFSILLQRQSDFENFSHSFLSVIRHKPGWPLDKLKIALCTSVGHEWHVLGWVVKCNGAAYFVTLFV